MSRTYLFFGDDNFKKLKIVHIDDFAEYKCFSALDCLPMKIENITLGWSFLIFKTSYSFLQSGFWELADNKEFHEIFSGFQDIKVVECGIKDSFFISKDCALYHFSNTTFNPIQIDCQNTKQNFLTVAAEDLFAVVLSEDGKAFDIKVDGNICVTPVDTTLKISQIACGKEHVLLLTNTGIVLSYGIGSHGQLGHGNIEKLDKPVVIEALEGIEIRKIAAGGWHSAAISSIGDLYVWGWNESGQLGLPCSQLSTETSIEEVITVSCYPKIIELNDEKVTDVSCGSRHTAAITEEKYVWTWGWNDYGQLGNKNCSLSDKPGKVILPEHFSPVEIKCKFWNTLVIGYFDE